MSHKSNKRFLGIAAALLLLPAGCTSEVTSVVAEVNPSGWSSGEAAQAIFPNSDTLALREIDIFMLCNERLGRDSLELFLTTTTPDSLTVTEMIVLFPSGAAGNTRYRQVTRPYRSNVLLAKTGEYRFEFRHEYISPLEGIKAVGVNIKYIEEPF